MTSPAFQKFLTLPMSSLFYKNITYLVIIFSLIVKACGIDESCETVLAIEVPIFNGSYATNFLRPRTQ